jgi:hypothetical protein
MCIFLTVCGFSFYSVHFPSILWLLFGPNRQSVVTLWSPFFIFYHITPLASYFLAVCAVCGSLCKIVMPTKWCWLTLGQMFQEHFNRCFRSQHHRKWLLKHRLKTLI